MAKYSGAKGIVYMSTTSGGTAVQVVGLNQWTLNANTDKYEVTEFGDTNKTFVQGLPNLQGTLSGFWDDTSDALWDASQSAGAINMYLYPSSDAATKYWYGTAFTDFAIDVSNAAAITISGSFAAASSWGQA